MSARETPQGGPEAGEVLCIIPARGGSVRIPRKNLAPLLGEPLVAHSIRHAKEAQFVRRVVVSTEDPEIAAVAQRYGAEVVRRPQEIAGATATSESALLHVLDHLERTESYHPDLVVFLQCTSPVRRRDDIDNAIRALLDQGADSLFSATRSHWLLWRRAEGELRSLNYDYRSRKRDQEMAEEFRENGSIYVFKPWVLREHNNRLGGRMAVYEMDYWSSFQVDSPEDLELCAWVLRRRREAERHGTLPAHPQAIVFDFDGVFTDNRVLTLQDGTEGVLANRSDGLALAELKKRDIPLLVLSTEENPVVAARCRKLRIECRQGYADKAAALRAFLEERGLEPRNVIYVGNDVNDLGCFALVGWPVAVADAEGSVRDAARVVLTRRGGEGVVRELNDLMREEPA